MTIGFVGFGGDAPLHFREFIDYLYKKNIVGVYLQNLRNLFHHQSRSMTLTKAATHHLRDPLDALYI
jgi:hypothetical protein